jgi:hypothetical protein
MPRVRKTEDSIRRGAARRRRAGGNQLVDALVKFIGEARVRTALDHRIVLISRIADDTWDICGTPYFLPSFLLSSPWSSGYNTTVPRNAVAAIASLFVAKNFDEQYTTRVRFSDILRNKYDCEVRFCGPSECRLVAKH